MAFTAVNAGQRNSLVGAEIVALSTVGGFRLSGPATKALGIKPGDNVMFFHDDVENVWAVGKGHPIFTSSGTPKMCSARINKKAIVERDFDNILAQALSSDNQELVDALSVEGITRDAQVALLADCIETPEVQDYAGSKCASPSHFTGEGASVNFTDTNIWAQLKADLEEKESLNRTFALNADEVIEIPTSNGFETVVVKALVLGEYVDAAPARK